MSKIFAQEQKETNATEVTVKELERNIEQGLSQASDALNRALQQYMVLKSNPEYSAGETATTLKLYIDRFNLLKRIIDQGSQEVIQNLGPLDPLPAPSADDEAGTLGFNQGRDQIEVARRHLLRVYPQINQLLTVVKTPMDKKEEWVLPFVSRVRDYQNIITLTKMLGLNKAARLTTAYPVSYQWRRPADPVNLKAWKTTATQVSAFKRAYPDYTFPQVLYHFTKDWDMFDRYKFKNWYKWTQRKAEANKVMEKKALQDFVQQDQAQKFQKKKKMLLSRIDLVRKCLRDLMSNSLITSDKGNKIYKILAMLEYEAYGITAPKLAAARFRRGGKQLQKLGFTEGSDVLFTTAKDLLNPGALIKTAQEKDEEDVDLGLKPTEDKEEKDKSKAKHTSDVLRRIKTQMDKLSYTRHLDELFYIKKDLESMGRDGDAESILKIIKDDLDGLDKLNKKLTDVYTNLSRLPVELSMKEDRAMAPHEKVQEMPIEVADEDIEIEEAPSEKPAAPAAPAQVARPARVPAPAPARPAAPKIETGIPNV